MLEVSTNSKRLDLNMIHAFLRETSWAKDRSFEVTQKAIENSFCFGLYFDSKQVGFARVVTDKVLFAYLFDVFILKEYRGRGWSKIFLEKIFQDSELKTVQWMLRSTDAGALYEKLGFKVLASAQGLYIKSQVN
jgi:ribosomal protein S18 acetylase RimI-like enzyme